jgi:hypothetical protein
MATNHKSENSKAEETAKETQDAAMDPLEAMALAELLAESKRAKDRTESMGVLGWAKPPPQTNINKMFLDRTLVSTRRDTNTPNTPSTQKVDYTIRQTILVLDIINL